MTDEIQRFKGLADLFAAEHAERLATGKLPETNQYRAARKAALQEAGLEDDDPGPANDLADMTAEDHFNRLGGNR